MVSAQQTITMNFPTMFPHHVHFAADQYEGQLTDVILWCQTNFDQNYHMDWYGMNTRKKWRVMFADESHATAFALRWC
jgi:hypothetical protein